MTTRAVALFSVRARVNSRNALNMVWSVVVILKVHIPSDHRAHPAFSDMTDMSTHQADHNADETTTVTAVTTSPKQSSSATNTSGRNLRRRKAPMVSPLPTRPSRSAPPLPSSLKTKILAKHKEWLEANKSGRAEVADSIEEELEVLEQQARSLNASAFRTWRKDGYGTVTGEDAS